MSDEKKTGREFTKEESRELFVNHCRGVAKYWSEFPNASPREVADGVAFGILSALDGTSIDLPGYRIVPMSTEDDASYFKEKGLNHHTPVTLPEELSASDIGGGLHEIYFGDPEAVIEVRVGTSTSVVD